MLQHTMLPHRWPKLHLPLMYSWFSLCTSKTVWPKVALTSTWLKFSIWSDRKSCPFPHHHWNSSSFLELLASFLQLLGKFSRRRVYNKWGNYLVFACLVPIGSFCFLLQPPGCLFPFPSTVNGSATLVLDCTHYLILLNWFLRNLMPSGGRIPTPPEFAGPILHHFPPLTPIHSPGTISHSAKSFLNQHDHLHLFTMSQLCWYYKFTGTWFWEELVAY